MLHSVSKYGRMIMNDEEAKDLLEGDRDLSEGNLTSHL
jgi:hypothetical protein